MYRNAERRTVSKTVWRSVLSFLAEFSGTQMPMAALRSGIPMTSNLKPHSPEF